MEKFLNTQVLDFTLPDLEGNPISIQNYKELDEAILLDEDNFLIRKQRWYIRYPEKFSPTIDIEWQQIQLQKEREEEAKLKNKGVCGLERCIIPGT